MLVFRARLLVLCALSLAAGCADAISPRVPSTPALARGSGGGGGGNPAPFIDISGVWNGSYTWLVANFGPIDGPNLPRIIGPVTLHEDAAGTITGTYCTPASLVCTLVTGKVANGLVELNGGIQFKGVPTTITCADGSTALEMDGPFRFSEGSGTWTLNSCP